MICAARSAALVHETVKFVKAAGATRWRWSQTLVPRPARAQLSPPASTPTAGLIRSSTTPATADRPSQCRITPLRNGITRLIPVSRAHTSASASRCRTLIAAGRGAIVNISSMAGRRGLAFRIGYCSAKAGQIGMTYGMALELGPHNITVNAIVPGAVEGDRIDRVVKDQATARGVDVQRMRQTFIERSPLRRMSTAEDISALAVFLCSDRARSISGQVIPVTAGEPA